MKNSKKILSTLLAVACIGTSAATTSVSAAALPDSGVVSPQYVAILSTSISLTEQSGQLKCYGKVSAQYGYTCNMVVELQQDNGSWDTVKTWTTSKNDTSTSDELWSPAKNYNYRLKITFNAYNSSGTCIETVTKYSSEVYYG